MSIKERIKRLIIRSVYVFGDSHAEVFKRLNSKEYFRITRFDVCWVGGATAQGLRNPNSKTDALKIYKDKIQSIKKKKSKLIFLLGEVDTGFVIWYRAHKYNENVEVQLQNSLSTFFEFIEWVQNEGFLNLYVMSVPLPTIKDGQNFGDVANARSEIKATQLQRTELTLKYNQLLKENSEKVGYKFISTDKYLMNPETNLIFDKFLNKDRTNHHLDEDQYSEIIYKAILEQKVLY